MSELNYNLKERLKEAADKFPVITENPERLLREAYVYIRQIEDLLEAQRGIIKDLNNG